MLIWKKVNKKKIKLEIKSENIKEKTETIQQINWNHFRFQNNISKVLKFKN